MTRGTRRCALLVALLAALTSGTTAGAATPAPSTPAPSTPAPSTPAPSTPAPLPVVTTAAGTDSDGGGSGAGSGVGESAGGGTGGLAQKQQGLSASLAAASAAIEGETAASTAARAALAATSAQLPAADAALSAANAILARDTAAVDAAAKAIAAATASLRQARAAKLVTDAAMTAQRARLAAAVRSSVEGGPTGLARDVVTATDPSSLVDNQVALSRLGNLTGTALAQLRVSERAEAAEVLRAGQAQAQLVAEQTIARAAQASATSAAGRAANAAQRVKGLVAAEASSYQVVRSQLATDQSNYAELDRESNQVAALIAAAERAAVARAAAAAAAAAAAKPTAGASPLPIATPGPEGLLWPTPGPVTSPFGYRVDPVTHQRALHAGVDIGAPVGQAIMAAQAGTVVFAGQEQGYGNYTCVDHGGGFATCYAHQSSILVRVGEVVARGQEIGLVGETGYATGPHLHFETRINGQPVNPLTYF